jgi:hypothetical protein
VGYCWFGSGQVLSLVGLAIGVRPVSSIWFGYRGESYEPVALGYSWVTEVQCHA